MNHIENLRSPQERKNKSKPKRTDITDDRCWATDRDNSETKQNEYKDLEHLSYFNIIIKTKEEDILKTSRIRISKRR